MLLSKSHGCVVSSRVSIVMDHVVLFYPPGRTIARGSIPTAKSNVSRSLSAGGACELVCGGFMVGVNNVLSNGEGLTL